MRAHSHGLWRAKERGDVGAGRRGLRCAASGCDPWVCRRRGGAAVPKSADIAIAVRDGSGFRRHPASAAFLRNVNTPALEYAPAISADLLELFFTRAASLSGAAQPAIYRSSRRSRDEPFGVPQRIAAITGFVEAPTLSGDGRSLYYHRLEDNRFVIYRVSR